jgi:hypothetical protein
MPFTEIITAYDIDNNLLGTFTVQGEMDDLANNSAVLIGIRDSTPEISTVVFSTTSTFGGYPGSIASGEGSRKPFSSMSAVAWFIRHPRVARGCLAGAGDALQRAPSGHGAGAFQLWADARRHALPATS